MADPDTVNGDGSGSMEADMILTAERIRSEGADWVTHLLSGTATRGDAKRLALWRARSPQHEAAYREALRMLRAVEGAAPAYQSVMRVREEDSDPHRTPSLRARYPLVDRRWVLGGALAASIAGALVIRPSLTSSRPDYRTAKGERRTLELGTGLKVEMNTLTQLSVETTAQGRRIELLEGQAVVKAALREPDLVELAAGNGVTRARQARFDVRHDEGDKVCITCLDGQVEVRNPHGRMQLAANEQVTYDKGRLGRSRSVDSAVVSAWQSGMLIFHNQPLSAVIAEVNRYRSGRIVIGSDALGRRAVEAVILLDQMQDVVRQVQQLSGARAVHLAGGIVVLI